MAPGAAAGGGLAAPCWRRRAASAEAPRARILVFSVSLIPRRQSAPRGARASPPPHTVPPTAHPTVPTLPRPILYGRGAQPLIAVGAGQANIASYDLSALLYLSDFGADFEARARGASAPPCLRAPTPRASVRISEKETVFAFVTLPKHDETPTFDSTSARRPAMSRRARRRRQGGAFAFLDAAGDAVVEPRRGRLAAFTSGPENLHAVERVTAGRRFVVAMWCVAL